MEIMIEAIKREVEKIISERIDKEIEDHTIAFHKELTERKDQYIAEVMKGIRIAHEYNPESMYMAYRIMFINRYAVEPQTESEIVRNSLRNDCYGCRFVGRHDTEFPCVNCTRKNKDYYDADKRVDKE